MYAHTPLETAYMHIFVAIIAAFDSISRSRSHLKTETMHMQLSLSLVFAFCDYLIPRLLSKERVHEIFANLFRIYKMFRATYATFSTRSAELLQKLPNKNIAVKAKYSRRVSE